MIRPRLEADLQTALQERDAERISLLRTTLGAIANAEAVPHVEGVTEVARKELTEDDIRAILESERDELLAVAMELDDIGAPTDGLHRQAALLQSYLT